MEVIIMHPDDFKFPGKAKDLTVHGLVPIGICREGDGDWVPLGLDQTRQPHAVVGGQAVPLDIETAGPAIFRALEETGVRLWGNAWNSSIGEIFGINRRTTQRDRVSRNLLPPRILQVISYIASADDGEQLAQSLVNVARYDKKLGGNKDVVRRYWRNVLDLYYGDTDQDIGVV